jgi:hypothetical protein
LGQLPLKARNLYLLAKLLKSFTTFQMKTVVIENTLNTIYHQEQEYLWIQENYILLSEIFGLICRNIQF